MGAGSAKSVRWQQAESGVMVRRALGWLMWCGVVGVLAGGGIGLLFDERLGLAMLMTSFVAGVAGKVGCDIFE